MPTPLTLKHNPTTITVPVYGVVGPSGTAWKVVNLSSVGIDGISLASGGAVINGGTGARHASISAGSLMPGYLNLATGVQILNGPATVANFGKISSAASNGVYFGAKTTAGRVTNFGTISGSGYGIYLHAGGSVANGATGTTTASISGGSAGVKILDGPATLTNFGKIASAAGSGVYFDYSGAKTTAGRVTNFGAISGGASGIYLVSGAGSVTNGAIGTTTASISGGESGVRFQFEAGTLRNFGTISGHSTFGASLFEGGAVTNGAAGARTASISGGSTGVDMRGAGAVTNFGTISGHSADGVDIDGSGAITNEAGALIAGQYAGVHIFSDPGTVTNFGTISGGTIGLVIDWGGSTVKNFGTIVGAAGTAVQLGFHDSTKNRLVIEPGAKFLGASGKPGTVDGEGGSTLELAAKSSGALLLGTQFIRFTNVVLDSGADWRVDFGLASLLPYETITGNGSNVLAFTAAGTFDLSGGRYPLTALRGFPTVSLTNNGPNSLTLADANFTGVAGGVVTVNGGSGDDTIVAALAAKHHVVLHGGAGADIFKLSPTTLATAKIDGGSGSDTLAPSAAGKLSVGGVSGVETYVLPDNGANSLSLTDANFAGVPGATITVDGVDGAGDTVDASSLTAADRVVFVVGPDHGTDIFIGGAGNDVFKFAALSATDKIKGGAGADQLVMTTAADTGWGGVSGVETFVLASDGGNLLSLTNASFAGVTGNKITVLGGAKGNTFTADLGAGHNLVLDGGAGDDLFTLSPAALAGATVKGRAGSNTLMVTGSGTLSAAGMSGVETIELPFTAANTLTLTNANFAGVTGGTITVFGGNGGDTITANLRSGLSVVLNGGSGTNRFNLSTAALAAAKVVGGNGADTLALTNPGTVAAGGVSGVETYRLADGGANSLTLSEANFGGLRQSAWITIQGGNAGNTINASTLESESPVILVGGLGKDIFTGGAGNDFFEFTAANLGAGDIVKGGTGSDELLMTSAGTVQAGGISGVETYVLAAGGANSLTLTNASFAGVTTVTGAPGNTITVLGGAKGNTLTANLGTGLGVVFDGGAGNDRITLSAATLAASIASIVSGGAGNDTLAVTGDGAVSLAGVTGVETIALSGAATLSLADANFTDVTGAAITVDGGAKADTISAAGVSATNRVVMNAGAGGATLVAAQNAQMTGGAGADVFELTTPGNAFGTRNQITIANFAHGTDKIAFSEFGFALGSTSVAATLFTANPTGSFTAPTQQFAYNTATGALYARGASSSQLLIATLSGHPTLAAGDITFVA